MLSHSDCRLQDSSRQNRKAVPTETRVDPISEKLYHVESFHGRLRDEYLNANWFPTLGDLRQKLADWQLDYKCEQPNSSLDHRTSQEFRHALREIRAMPLILLHITIPNPENSLMNG